MNEYLEKALRCARSLPVIGKLFELHPKVAVIRFSGVIADSSVKKNAISYSRYAKAIDKAFDKPRLKAVALVINSPGGAPSQTALLANHIRQLAEEKNIPVFAFVEDVAASGGYWLACVADEVYALETSIVGSIGVISASFGFEDFIEKHDIHRRLYTSGDNKSFLDPFSPEKKEDVDRLGKIQKEIHESFKNWIIEQRGEKLQGTEKKLFDGSFWTAAPALEKGLIDGLGDIRAVTREKFGEKIQLDEIEPEKKLFSALPFIGKIEQDSLAEELLNTLEDRAFWSRYGL